MKKVIKKTLISTFIAATTIFGISTASAGPNEGVNTLLLKAPLIIPDLGVAHLSAVVSANGRLVRGSGVRNTTSVKGSIGDYIVNFNRNVRNCTYVVSLGNTGSTGVPKTGVISATGANISSNGVYIDVNDTNGIAAQRPFHLNVFCHK